MQATRAAQGRRLRANAGVGSRALLVPPRNGHLTDEEGDVLVEWVGSAGAVPHRICVFESDASTRTVELARHLTEPEVSLPRRALHKVRDAAIVSPPTPIVSLRSSINKHARTLAIGRCPLLPRAAETGKNRSHTNACGFDNKCIFNNPVREWRTAKSGRV